MSGGGGTPTQTTQYTLGPDQQKILAAAMPSITSFAATTPQRYQGSTVAPFTEAEKAGQEMALAAAKPQAEVAANAGNLTNTLLSTDPNARRDSTIAAVTAPIYDNLTQRVLPAVRSGSAGGGGYGSSRQGIAEALAAEAANRDAGEAASKTATSIYNTDVDAQLKALGLVPQTQQAYLAPATTTSAVGDVQRSMDQALLDQAVGNFNFDTNNTASLAKAQELIALLGGLPEGGALATGSVPQPGATQALGGAAAGATLGSALFPGVGTAIGAGAGAVLPFLFSRT